MSKLKLSKKNISKIFLNYHKMIPKCKYKKRKCNHINGFNKQALLKYIKRFSSTLEAKVNLVEATRNCINDDALRNKTNLDICQKEIALFQNKIENYKTVCQDLHRALALTRISMMDLEEKIAYLEKASYDSCFIWKISNVYERYQEALSGRQTSFFSHPFYTNRYGYKMCCRLYLNGDGSGRGTHVSLYFVLLKGEYDSLLEWPFRHKVKFVLLDQSNKCKENEANYNEDHVDIFKADPNSNSFKRPVNDMNLGSGLPQFCTLKKLFGSDSKYLKDNSIFIKVLIE